MENNVKLNKQDFELVQMHDDIKDQKFEGEAIGFFKDAMLRFKKNKGAIVAACLIGLIVVLAIIGPSLNKFTYREQALDFALLPPRIQGLEKLGIFDGTKTVTMRETSIEDKYKGCVVDIERKYNLEYRGKKIPMVEAKVDMYKFKKAEDQYYWFGTDSLGRDQFTRLWRGARISLIIGILSVMCNVFIGVVYGSVSGYYGGMVDMLMQRFIEILGGIPQIVVIILFIMYVGPGIIPLIMALVLKGWIGTSRMIRGQFYKYKRQEYVLASRTLGAKDSLLIFRHILPNAIGPIITSAVLAVPAAIFTEAFLAYLGLGVQAPEPSIGVLLAEGQKMLLDYPHLILFPAITISVLMISFNLFGNGLRDAFDPTLRGNE